MNSTRSRRVRVGGTLVALVAGLLAGPALAVSPAVAEETAVPTVSVSKTAFLPDETAAITVTGTGFDPELAKGAHPPLAGRPSGVYIAFGRFSDDWAPSSGSPRSSRPAADVNWAVLAENLFLIGGAANGGIVLTPEGGFEATLTVSKDSADAAAKDLAGGNYGIYTYPGGGATQPLYETYTPITFGTTAEPAASTITLAAGPAAYGRAATATATVTAEGGATPSGEVEVLQGAKVLGTATLDNGTAVVKLPARLRAGTHQLTARYAGDTGVAPSSTTATLRVAKAASRVVAKVAKKRVKVGKRVRLNIQVGSPVKGVRPTAGTVRVQMRGFAKVVKINKAGKARVVLPARKKAGNFKVVVTYRGAANFKAARTTAVQRVAR
ncbi:Ig-like domain-containing protein [Nocardioides massiliensis]|uniref:Bacterial Ig-like domain-containing protein n=1 Tax=Nocardioides massiliensis TaxID=1325935 RepID=A0ABT9NRP6_9ACTN|nr:Ig-like domain-containing protein [Nocardioides massiliensis]MDP9823078.1 hypothetical protein [Nocardioides massiliensis]